MALPTILIPWEKSGARLLALLVSVNCPLAYCQSSPKPLHSRAASGIVNTQKERELILNTEALRAVLIPPKLENIEAIERVRERCDPSFEMVPPHITLVFPFRSEIPTEEVHAHVESALRDCSQFPLRMQGITGHEGSHLFLNVIHGNDAIIDLHRRLYSGLLAPYQNRAYTFFPHLTVGRFVDELLFEEALASLESFDVSFETMVDEVSVIAIEQDGRARTTGVVRLVGSWDDKEWQRE